MQDKREKANKFIGVEDPLNNFFVHNNTSAASLYLFSPFHPVFKINRNRAAVYYITAMAKRQQALRNFEKHVYFSGFSTIFRERVQVKKGRIIKTAL